MEPKLTVLIFGASGRMGQAIKKILSTDPDVKSFIEVDARQQDDVGTELAKSLPLTSLVLDFSSPEGTEILVGQLVKTPVPTVFGTTGLSPETMSSLEILSSTMPWIHATNFSVGMNLLWLLAEQAASVLGPDAFDVEIVEIHHRFKKDAPSGSALTLMESVRRGRNEPASPVTFPRSPDSGARMSGTIGMAALRGGDVTGEHTVFFFGEAERVELTHRATDRSIFARGAWRAALWLLHRPPGRYGMKDVLFDP